MMQDWMWDTEPIGINFTDGSIDPSSQDHCVALVEALRGYAKIAAGEESDFAAGTRVDERGSETFYVEHKIGNTKTARVELTPRRCRASIANPSMGNSVSKVKDLLDVAPAIWFAYIYLNKDGGFGEYIEKISQELYYGCEPDQKEDFELNLTNFEAKAMTVHGPVDGSENSLPVLDKKIKGPQKIICGKFETFPDAVGKEAKGQSKGFKRDAVMQYVLDTEVIRAYRASLTPEQKARVPEIRDDHVYKEEEVYAYEVFKKTENDKGDLAVKVCQVTGPAAAGKSQFAEQFAANNGLPFYSLVGNESTRVDDWKDQWVPYLVGSEGNIPTLSSEEKAVNRAMKEDAESRDAVELAIEALDLPSPIEAKFDPDYAWEALGESGKARPVTEIISMIEEKAKAVLNSLKEKLESAEPGNLTLAYKCVPSPLTAGLAGGGVIEMGELATMRKGELSKLHDLLDYNRRGSIMTAEGETFRHDCCYFILTNNLEYDEDHPMTLPMISRMSLDIEFPQLDENEATERLCSILDCEPKRAKVKEIVQAYIAIGKEAMALSLPGGIDFRNLKQITNRIVGHDFEPRKVFEREVIHHFVEHSDPESKVRDEASLLSILDELDLFR